MAVPKLEKSLKPVTGNAMAAEELVVLSRSSQNLQRIEIENSVISFLPTIIELFPKLKTVKSDFLDDE